MVTLATGALDASEIVREEVARLRAEIGPLPGVRVRIIPAALTDPLAPTCDCGCVAPANCTLTWATLDPLGSGPDWVRESVEELHRLCVARRARAVAPEAAGVLTIEFGMYIDRLAVKVARSPRPRLRAFRVRVARWVRRAA